MKASLLLAAAFALTTSAALSQTVAPGTQTGNPSNMSSAGSPNQITTTDRMGNMPDADRKNKRMMQKSGKTKTSYDGKKMKTKM